MIKEDLHILMLEDDPFDADLNKEQLLLLEEYNCMVEVGQDQETLLKALESPTLPQLILCDYNLPQYNGLEALKDLKNRNPLIPFIFVTGAMQEELAADTIKAGAWDFVVKDRLFRLPLAIRGVLKLKKEREKLLEAERKSQRLLKAIEETSTQIIVLDKEKKIEYVNKNFTNVTEYTPTEVIGKAFTEFYRHSKDEKLIQLLDTGEVFHGEVSGIRKNGSPFWENISITPINGGEQQVIGYIIIKEDISRKKETEQELIVSEERLHLAVSGANLGLWDWNIDTGEVVFNERWANMLGYGLSEIDPNMDAWMKLIHPNDLAYVTDELEKHMSGKVGYYKTEHRMLAKDGSWKWILNRGRVMQRNENGKALRATGTHMDITDRKLAESQLQQSVEESQAINVELKESLNKIEKINEELQEAKKKAEESDRLKTAFLANLSHEIRTPMNGILGFADLLKDKDIPKSTQIKYIGVIEESGQRMLRLISDLINISKIESNQIELNIEETNLNSLMDKIHDFFSPQAASKGLQFTCYKTLADNKSKIWVDDLKLDQILTNLIGNALKFTSEGSIHFEYRVVNGDNLVFKVRDTGEGIPPDMQEIIFERFRQADFNYFKGVEGTGLGLSISKAFIELMEGDIRVESEVGKGSEFVFTLPFKPLQEEEVELEPEPVADDEKDTILVAEDDQISYLFLERLLKLNGINVLRARNGKEAVEVVAAHPEISMVFIDMKMPIMDGLDATKEIKKNLPALPVIAQTAYVTEIDRQNAFDAGCDEFMTKPVKKEDIIAKISHYKKNRNKARP